MKRKILMAILLFVALFIAYLIGKGSANNGLVTYQDKCDFMADIVDWNTDGNELAVFTKDGYEFYAYKTDNIYINKNFIPVEEVK